jgi:hypothetical protein
MSKKVLEFEKTVLRDLKEVKQKNKKVLPLIAGMFKKIKNEPTTTGVHSREGFYFYLDFEQRFRISYHYTKETEVVLITVVALF